jgi:hypothetical protein
VPETNGISRKEVHVPAAGLLRDCLLSGMAKGRQDRDWLTLALGAAEEAGLSPQG